MKLDATVFPKTLVLVVCALALAVFLIVRPVLAQEEATSSAPVDISTSTESAVDMSTNTESVASTSEATTSDPSADPVTNTTETSSDTSTATTETTSDSSSATDTSAEVTSDGADTTSSEAIEEPAEQPPPGLTEVRIIGTKYIDYFTDGTTEYSFPGDPDIDSHFAEPNAPIPTHEGLTWVHTTGQPLYDTESGDLEVGQYAFQANGKIIANYVFVSSTSTPSTAGLSSDESNSAASPEVLGASTSSTTQSDTPAAAPKNDSSSDAADASTAESHSRQSDAATATADFTSSNAQSS